MGAKMNEVEVNVQTHPDQFKIHETIEDRKRQRAILKEFAQRFNLTGKLTNTLSRLDATLYRDGEYFAIAEAKYRNNPIGKYSDYTIDVAKVDALIERARVEGVHAILVVSWEGDTRYLSLSKVAREWDGEDTLFTMKRQLRRDRSELADWVYCIPTSMFKVL